jgi:hypothetical protein
MDHDDTNPPVQHGSPFLLGYERQRPALLAVPRKKLIPVNLDVPAVCAFARSALRKLRPFYPRMLALPEIKQERIEAAEDALFALVYAQALHRAASAPVIPTAQLYTQLLGVRTTLLSDANTLARRNLIPGDKLKELRAPATQASAALDVMALVSILRAHLSTFQGKSAVNAAELAQAEMLADRMIVAAGERAHAGDELPAAHMRQAAFTHFVRCYKEIRRAMTYLRWHEGDVDKFAPSLYSFRVGRAAKRNKSAAPAADAVEASALPSAAAVVTTATLDAPSVSVASA